MHVVEQNFKDFLKNNKTKFEHFFIAYSGGVDSQVLLYLASKYLPKKVTALHVNHGISKNAFDWENFCIESSSNLNVNIEVKRFDLSKQKSNLEEKARELRHSFFEEMVDNGNALFTGHHLDDQAETFLLRLMRGSGIDGLSSMSEQRPMNKGSLLRPLLSVSKEEIIDFALSVKLNWVEDESNKVSDYDRNFLRNEVIPLLKTRWKNANKSIANSAKHCEKESVEKQNTLKKLSEDLIIDNKVDTVKLESQSKKIQKDLIRFWLKENNQKMLDIKALDSLINEVALTNSDKHPCYKNKNYEVRKHNNFLYFIKKDEILIFSSTLSNLVKENYNPNERMLFNGINKKLKAILKDSKIPYWEREMYSIFRDKKTLEIKAVGDVKSDDFDLEITKKYTQ